MSSEGFLRQIRDSTNIKLHHITDAVAEVMLDDYVKESTHIEFRIEASGNWHRLDTDMVLTAMLRHLLGLKIKEGE